MFLSCLIFPLLVKTNVREHSHHLHWLHPVLPPTADPKWPFHCGTVRQQRQIRWNDQHLLEMWIIQGSLSHAASESFRCEKCHCPNTVVVSWTVSNELGLCSWAWGLCCSPTPITWHWPLHLTCQSWGRKIISLGVPTLTLEHAPSWHLKWLQSITQMEIILSVCSLGEMILQNYFLEQFYKSSNFASPSSWAAPCPELTQPQDSLAPWIPTTPSWQVGL